MLVETTFIYALNDPETGECRYVGKADDLQDAFSRHMRDGRKKSFHKANWIKSLIARGLKPVLEILQEVPYSEWELWERVWIKASRKIGINLTNCTDGGDGGTTPEMCAKSAASRKGKKRSPGFCKNQRARMVGKKWTPEAVAKRSATNAGIKRSPETCVKIREAIKIWWQHRKRK